MKEKQYDERKISEKQYEERKISVIIFFSPFPTTFFYTIESKIMITASKLVKFKIVSFGKPIPGYQTLSQLLFQLLFKFCMNLACNDIFYI